MVEVALSASMLMLGACSNNDEDVISLEHAVRDSAGVRIVTNRPSHVERWSIAGQPRVQIGTAGSQPEQQLFRVTRAVRLAGGSIAVANTGTSEIRVYDSLGVWMRSIGRPGDGPGEYRNVRVYRQHGTGALVTYDLEHTRLSWFNERYELQRTATFQIPATVYCPMPIAILSDGKALVQPWCTVDPGERTEGTYRNVASFKLYDSSGDSLRTIVELPASEGVVADLSRDRSRCTLNGDPCIYYRGALFGRGAPTASDGAHLYYSDAERFEVRVFALDGTLLRLIRRPMAPRQVLPEDYEAHLTARAAARPARSRSTPDWRPVPTAFPALGSMLVDSIGSLWVQHYVGPRDSEQIWSVFDTSGRFLAEVPMPADLTVYEIGADWILVGWQDEMDIPYVRLYELERGASTRSSTTS